MKGEHSVGIRQVVVRRRPGERTKGVLLAGGRALPVALGRSGPALRKREGDGATPVGRFRILQVLYRPDRVARPRTRLPVRPIAPDDGWSDDPADRRYNRPVKLPRATSHERMWRADGLYDLVLVIDHNQAPRVPGLGSAVFVHVARGNAARGRFEPTQGCVALTRPELARLIARLAPGAFLTILP